MKNKNEIPFVEVDGYLKVNGKTTYHAVETKGLRCDCRLCGFNGTFECQLTRNNVEPKCFCSKRQDDKSIVYMKCDTGNWMPKMQNVSLDFEIETEDTGLTMEIYRIVNKESKKSVCCFETKVFAEEYVEMHPECTIVTSRIPTYQFPE